MKCMKLAVFGLSLLTLVSCKTAAGNGALIGTGAGAALGAVAGRLIGGSKGTVIGAAVGGAVGATAGTLIGRHMDKVKARAAADLANAQIEGVTDINGLPAIKATFDSGLLFTTGSATLSANSTTDLAKFANLLKDNTDCAVAIQGYTDNQGWKNSTAAQSQQKNIDLSQKRADAVKNKLVANGVSANQIASSTGYGEANPVADNATAAGKAQNRRVEVYLYASDAMIKAAEAGTLD